MASSEVIAATTTAVALNAGGNSATHLVLATSDQVYLGDADVDTGGFPLDETQGFLEVDLQPGDVLYVVAGATANVSVLRT